MVYIYDLSKDFMTMMAEVYTFLFETTLSDHFLFNLPWYIPNPLDDVFTILSAIFPQLGIAMDMTLSQLIIGVGLPGLLLFKFIKFFVGIVTGS